LLYQGVTIPKHVALETNSRRIPARVQVQPNSAAIAVSEFPPADIAKYLSEHPNISKALLMESYDKRFTPSTFISERGDGFDVGWFTREAGYQVVQTFSSLADAATDYLLFSLGKGRWTSQQ
jgi:hypothetical protein